MEPTPPTTGRTVIHEARAPLPLLPEAPAPPSRPPLVLIADDQEWTARAFESVLGPAGFAVLRAASGRQALEQARSVAPDVVLMRADLSDHPGAILCRLLRREAHVGPATPLFVTTAVPLGREKRLEVLRAGAWDVLGLPLDAEELLLKLGALVRAKFEVDHAREESLVDPATGFYSVHGLLRRVGELGLEAERHPAPLGCAVLAADEEWTPPGCDHAGRDDALVAWMVRLVSASGRRSDVIGRLSQTELAVIAPHTGESGVRRLARRFLDDAAALAAREGGGPGGAWIRVGCYAVDDFSTAAMEPVELLVRATMALRRAQRDAASAPVCFFEPPLAVS